MRLLLLNAKILDVLRQSERMSRNVPGRRNSVLLTMFVQNMLKTEIILIGVWQFDASSKYFCWVKITLEYVFLLQFGSNNKRNIEAMNMTFST
jgi:hypothetical protein